MGQQQGKGQVNLAGEEEEEGRTDPGRVFLRLIGVRDDENIPALPVSDWSIAVGGRASGLLQQGARPRTGHATGSKDQPPKAYEVFLGECPQPWTNPTLLPPFVGYT